MLLELSYCIDAPVITNSSTKIGSIDFPVFDGKQARLVGFQVVQTGIVKKFRGLLFDDIVEITRSDVQVAAASSLQTNLKSLDEHFQEYGSVVGVTAKTESGKRLGKVLDVVIETGSGRITRFYIRNFLQERIIPVQFLVTITPREVIFKDVVSQPIFDRVAVAETA